MIPIYQHLKKSLKSISVASNNIARMSELYQRKLKTSGSLEADEMQAFFEMLSREMKRIQQKDSEGLQWLDQQERRLMMPIHHQAVQLDRYA